MTEIIEKIVEEVRDRCFGEGEGGVEELLLVQLLMNPQGIDSNLLPLILLAGRGGFHGRRKLALLAFAISQQQAQAATTATSGVQPTSSSNNLLMTILALGLFGEEREAPRRKYWGQGEPDDVDVVVEEKKSRGGAK
jgi:hypothetical protein